MYFILKVTEQVGKPHMLNYEVATNVKPSFGYILLALIQEAQIKMAKIYPIGTWKSSKGPKVQVLEENALSYSFTNTYKRRPIKAVIQK